MFSSVGSLHLYLTQIDVEATFMPASAFLLLYDFFPDRYTSSCCTVPVMGDIFDLPSSSNPFLVPGLLPEVLLVESWKDSLSQSKFTGAA